MAWNSCSQVYPSVLRFDLDPMMKRIGCGGEQIQNYYLLLLHLAGWLLLLEAVWYGGLRGVDGVCTYDRKLEFETVGFWINKYLGRMFEMCAY